MASQLAALAGSAEPLSGPAGDSAALLVRQLIKERRQRDKLFGDIFADPAWDILLELFASRIEARSISVSSLCIAAAVPATTALRWIAFLTDQGMLVRRQDKADGRRVYIDLSDDAFELMGDYIRRLPARAALL